MQFSPLQLEGLCDDQTGSKLLQPIYFRLIAVFFSWIGRCGFILLKLEPFVDYNQLTYYSNK